MPQAINLMAHLRQLQKTAAEAQVVEQEHKSVNHTPSSAKGEGMEDRNLQFGKKDTDDTDYDAEQPTGSGNAGPSIDPLFKYLHDPNSTAAPVAIAPCRGGGTAATIDKAAGLRKRAVFWDAVQKQAAQAEMVSTGRGLLGACMRAQLGM